MYFLSLSHTHTHTHTHTHIYIYIHTYTYTHTSSYFFDCFSSIFLFPISFIMLPEQNRMIYTMWMTLAMWYTHCNTPIYDYCSNTLLDYTLLKFLLSIQLFFFVPILFVNESSTSNEHIHRKQCITRWKILLIWLRWCDCNRDRCSMTFFFISLFEGWMNEFPKHNISFRIHSLAWHHRSPNIEVGLLGPGKFLELRNCTKYHNIPIHIVLFIIIVVTAFLLLPRWWRVLYWFVYYYFFIMINIIFIQNMLFRIINWLTRGGGRRRGW